MSSARNSRLFKFMVMTLTAMAMTLSVSFCQLGGKDGPDSASLALSKHSADSEAGGLFVEVAASGAWTLTLEDMDGAWADVTPSSGVGDMNNVILSYSENTSESERSLTVTLACGNARASETFRQDGKTPSESDYPEDGHWGADISSCGWMELPETKEDGRDMFSHFMNLDQGKVRNYSYDWDYENLVSAWVAYPLNQELMGSGSRTNIWGIDPNLPLSKQSNISLRGFQPSAIYARGHQCPSADRVASTASNMQTFYGTNMTPQMHGFNEGIWSNLEGRVRNWAKSLNSKTDTLYVATGCVTGPDSFNDDKKEMPGGYALDNDGKKVAIPIAYWKAVLRYQKNSTYGYSGYVGCAFYFDHKDYGQESVTKSIALSIDELEDKLGLDLFVNLPAAIGEANAAKVEAQDPKNVQIWW